MIPVSAAIAVKQQLKAILDGCLDIDPTLTTKEPPLVVYNEPGTNEPPDIAIVGAISETKHPEAMVGGGGVYWQDETFQIEVTFTSFRGGDDMLAVEQRALHMLGLFDQALRADPSLGGTVTVCYVAEYESDTGWTDDNLGVASDVKAKVHIENQL